MSKFWCVQDGDEEVWIVYVETHRKPKKYKGSPMATYFVKGKLVALQFKVIPNSKDQISLFSEYGITNKDKEKSFRRKKHEIE